MTKLYAICLVKNEADIVGETLRHAARFCDRIFVVDNGSTDGTWEIVQRLAQDCAAVVPAARKDQPYDEGLRWLVYDAHHAELAEDDWWLVLDADELLAEDPRPVIEQAMRERADVIKAWQIQFYFTDRDCEAWRSGKEDASRPIVERRRYYRIDWQEPRLFRNQRKPEVIFRQSKLLTPNTPWAQSVRRVKGKVCRRRVMNRHFQYRDPVQIERRIELRFGDRTFAAQVRSLDWTSAVRPARGLQYYEPGRPWRFSLAGVSHSHWGWLRYVVRSRLRRLARALPGRTRFANSAGPEPR